MESALLVHISKKLHDQLKIQAIKEGLSLRELCNKIFTQYIEEKNQEG